MKQLLLFFFTLPLTCLAQEQQYDTIPIRGGHMIVKKGSSTLRYTESQSAFKSKYGTAYSVGDTVYFGRGTLPTANFAFINESLNSFSAMATMSMREMGDSRLNRIPLPAEYAWQHGIIKDLGLAGNKRSGKFWIAIIGVGSARRYSVPLNAAIEAGEIIDPRKPVTQTVNAVTAPAPASVADELKKLGELKKEGLLTEEEFQEQKKKLLAK